MSDGIRRRRYYFAGTILFVTIIPSTFDWSRIIPDFVKIKNNAGAAPPAYSDNVALEQRLQGGEKQMKQRIFLVIALILMIALVVATGTFFSGKLSWLNND